MREQNLDNWLNNVLKTSQFKKEPLAGDASFRRYYRVRVDKTEYIIMDAPPPEVPHLFVKVAAILEKQGLQVPNILAANMEQGFLLLSDLGDRLYLHELTEETVDKLYHDALQALLKFQSCQAELPIFDRTFFQRQLDIFEEWYLHKHLGLQMRAKLPDLFTSVYDQLFAIMLEQPQVFIHRDFHSRNLMVVKENNPGILDFQDAMIGPITYDLVSLLQDYYITWPRMRVEQWVLGFQKQAELLGLLSTTISVEQFLRWFDLTGLQRHLKNLGIFARLYYRDNKAQYLKDIPQVLKYMTETCDRYVELQPLAAFLQSLPNISERTCAP